MDFTNYKFRCSGLAHLLVNGRSKKEILSETTKAYLRELWIKEAFNREKYVTTKFMKKGTIVESDSLDLVQEVTGQTYFKNSKRFENDYIAGTPDVVKDRVIDIKSSWDIWTFSSIDEKKAHKSYYPQMLGYMWLTKFTNSELIYCLVNTPLEQVEYELYKLKVSGMIEDNPQDEGKARLNFEFGDIEPSLRMKSYTFEFDESIKNTLIERIEASREYMNTLSL
jgi:hypothetical protein